MSDVLVNFLYETCFGRFILKGLVNPVVSKIGGVALSSRFSKVLIKPFIEGNEIDMSNYLIPDKGFSSFNDFFIRQKAENIEISDSGLICPCDGYLACLKIDKDSVFEIKNTRYSLYDLLDDELLTKEFSNGYAFIFRLMPHNYHRYLFCMDGRIKKQKKIKGVLHSIRPICHNVANVYVQNSREYCLIDSVEYGYVVQLEIGALMVGKISNHPLIENSFIKKGNEKGYFEFGGSTIVILANVRQDMMRYPVSEKEISVRAGDPLIW